MSSRLISKFAPTKDLDYVECFQRLQSVNLRIESRGPTTGDLVQKVLLELELGNYQVAYETASRLVSGAPNNLEAHFLAGRCGVMLALAQADVVPLGANPPAAMPMDIMQLVQEALAHFDAVVASNSDDVEANENAHALRTLVDGVEDSEALVDTLRFR